MGCLFQLNPEMTMSRPARGRRLCSCRARVAAWKGIHKRLPEGYRFVSTSLCGYGGAEETRTLAVASFQEQLKVIGTVTERAGGLLHLVGHSFGGTIGLAAALAPGLNIASVATFEANPMAIMKDRDPAL